MLGEVRMHRVDARVQDRPEYVLAAGPKGTAASIGFNGRPGFPDLGVNNEVRPYVKDGPRFLCLI